MFFSSAIGCFDTGSLPQINRKVREAGGGAFREGVLKQQTAPQLELSLLDLLGYYWQRCWGGLAHKKMHNHVSRKRAEQNKKNAADCAEVIRSVSL